VSRRLSLALAAFVALVLAGYVVGPSVELFVLGLNAERLADLFGEWRSANVRALVNTLSLALGTVVGAGAVGTGLAWALYRYDLPLRKLLFALAALPLALPPLVGVLAFLFLYGESGILPRGLQMLFGLDDAPFSFDGLWAVLAVHVYVFYVYFYLFVLAALHGLDTSVLEASADLGASARQTFWRVVLPLLRPALTSAALLVFMLAMASFTAPLLFAGTENFLTLQIYNYKLNGDLDLAASVSVVLTLICFAFLLLLEGRGGTPFAFSTGKGTGAPPKPLGGWARVAAGVVVALGLAVLLLPVGVVLLLSFAEEGSWTTQLLPARYTLVNYTSLLGEQDVFAPIGNSLRMATLATLGNLVVGVVAALVIVKGRLGRGGTKTRAGRTLRWSLRLAAVLPFAIPGTVIGINLIVAFDEPSAWTLGQVLVGTFWILPLAYFVRHLPLVVRGAMAALEGYDDRLTEASADLGARFVTTFRRVMLPLVLPGIVAGTLLAFVTALGEFVSSILLYVYGNRPISVEILAQLRQYDFGSAAAYSVLLMGLVALATAATRFVGSSR
jgi:iron(III) transport system permease protein